MIEMEYSLTCLSFDSFNVPIYEKRIANIQFLILCLIIWCTLQSEKYGSYNKSSQAYLHAVSNVVKRYHLLS